jgi:transposase
MAAAVEITRLELSAAELRHVASGLRGGAMVRRVLALAMVLDGASRTEAAEACGMDRQTLRDWVHRYNEQGIAGLADRARLGRPPTLTTEQMAELKALVVQGPEPERDGVVRWRCADLRAVIAERYQVTVHERTVGKLLCRLGLTRLQPRPYHPKKDAEAQATFKKTSPAW